MTNQQSMVCDKIQKKKKKKIVPIDKENYRHNNYPQQ